ncbi:sensor histidine kinase [Cognaticolwellia mytili]|uniref:sensor histidine kinase n=1 Tax=Cognaticolwellia mytili TaxID=1888913 RepID=UPI000A177C33|nr:HAMP domain-containing sensor histidine kinase [Cognaticolwellia mytili]
MINTKPMSSKIIQVYLRGIIVLLIFYGAIFYHTILYTENQNSERRLALVAPYHFKLFSQSSAGEIKIDPMLTIYDQYDILPSLIKRRLNKDWQGSISFHFEDDSEYGVYAQQVMTKKGLAIAYAIEDVDAIEWDDMSFALFQLVIFSLALLIFVISVIVSIKMARRISEPFSNLTEQLKNNNESYAPLSLDGELSLELVQMLTGINTYRSRIQDAFIREKAFTRYVSHELRTPMTVIRGAISVLRLQKNEKAEKQYNRIDVAIVEMEQLIHTFLLLARDENLLGLNTTVSDEYISNLLIDIEPTIQANQVKFHQQVQCEFNLSAQPLLFSAIIKNLLKNAVNCTVGGNVDLFISPQRIDVIDNGVGLDAKPRGYEGFGIGLNIVRDICEKYQWQFSIENNSGDGCTASVIFNFINDENS